MTVVFSKTGIRGEAGKYPLEPISLVRLGMIIAKVFRENNNSPLSFVIGRDTRVSSYMITNALTSGLLAGGANVVLVGVEPTPAIVYFGKSFRACASIAVTASHNPYQDNGLKLFLSDGNRISDDMQKKIDELLQSDAKFEVARELGKIIKIEDADGRYIEYLKSFFPNDFNLRDFKIGLDVANGACYKVAEKLFTELGANIEIRGNKPNGKNINAGFGSVYPEVVAKLVVDNSLDLGIAVDGDGDRVVMVTSDGKILDGDALLAIIGSTLKEMGKLNSNINTNVIVANVMSNLGLDLFLKNHGVAVKRSNVGEVPVLNEMKKNDASVGGEQSGHIIFKDGGNSGDALLASLKILEIMKTTNKSLKELKRDYKGFPQCLKNLSVASKPEIEEIKGYAKLKEDIENEFKEDGRILIRYSETENKIRIMVEHKDESVCKKALEKLVIFFEEKIGI
ncbi:MAG: phosphoglucosamine mutase [Bdellovibrionota bacterium]